MSERERRLDAIRSTSDTLTELARRYDRLRWMAEQPAASDAFLNLAEAAGKMTEASLDQLSALLDILFESNLKIGKDGKDEGQVA